MISGSPVERGRDRPRARGGADERASNKFGGRIGGINRGEEVDIDEMINKMGAETERAACSKGGGEVGRGCDRRESGDKRRRSRIAEE